MTLNSNLKHTTVCFARKHQKKFLMDKNKGETATVQHEDVLRVVWLCPGHDIMLIQFYQAVAGKYRT
jgi:hypothetical protein